MIDLHGKDWRGPGGYRAARLLRAKLE